MIELLTVFAIIAILAGLLFPAIRAAMTKAKSARARTMVQHAGAAFRAYFTEYSMWPTNSSETVVFELTTNLFRNTASITFLDVSPRDIGQSPSSGTFTNRILDPWNNPYLCVVDGQNYGGFVQIHGGGTISSGYAIWSTGPDGLDNSGVGQDVGVNRDNIRSW